MIIGLDVGGTHTDVVLLDNRQLLKEIKILTDPSDLFNTVLAGLKQVTQGLDTQTISRTVLSTTLTTNAVVQNKLPKVGMIVSGGPGIDPENYRTGPFYYSVAGSIDHRGREVEPINPEEIQAIAKEFKNESIEYVGVVAKFSTRNPKHEIEIRDVLSGIFKKVFPGHLISGNLNFPRRIATTYLNTAVYPIHIKFFEAVKTSLDKKGLLVPIHMMKADGGTMSFDASIDFPGQTILSGPAASVIGSIVSSRDSEESLVLDIGGTTTDMAILINRVPLLDPDGIDLGKYNTLIRSLKTHSLGIGGDSHVRVEAGELKIGPERVGPAMAYGGSSPTPTDAIMALGLIEAGDRENAMKGIEAISAELGLSVKDTAEKIFDQTCKKILSEAKKMIVGINSKPVYTVHELKEGHMVKPEKIIVLGGPAPYFAKHLEKLSGYPVKIVPKWGVANAVGAGLARTTCDVTLLADTEQGNMSAPEENFSKSVAKDFSREEVIETAFALLKKKALQKGADADDLEMEVIENQQFNMVRGFYTKGRNIRVKVQVKPGLIHEFDLKSRSSEL